jgi:sporulation protein YlmC with PRC-barrel domain
MPIESGKFLPVQHYIGLQVIDTKGSLIGNVKDIALNFTSREVSFRVTTSNKTEMDFSLDDIQSVQDVVLLKKSVDLPQTEPQENLSDGSSSQALVICPSCGTSVIPRAKFCSKCGSDLKL